MGKPSCHQKKISTYLGGVHPLLTPLHLRKLVILRKTRWSVANFLLNNCSHFRVNCGSVLKIIKLGAGDLYCRTLYRGILCCVSHTRRLLSLIFYLFLS